MRRIALVGDIGSGKTFISNLFRYPVFNADLVVSNLYKKDKSLFRKIKKRFPDKVRKFPLKKERGMSIMGRLGDLLLFWPRSNLTFNNTLFCFWGLDSGTNCQGWGSKGSEGAM